jgi:hypothetical protein
MAKTFTEVPVFVKGEPGFAAKLNQLGDVLREVIAALSEEATPAVPVKATRRTATKAE